MVSRDEALKFLDDLSAKFSANQGEGLAFLAESSTSPSRARLQKIIAQKFPQSKWFTYDAIDSGIHQRAATQAFGQPVKPIFNFDKAKVILSLDCDFLGGEDDAHNHIRKFAAGRKAGDGMSRLYAVESLFTLTGANADHRLRVAASLVGANCSSYLHNSISAIAIRPSSSSQQLLTLMQNGFRNVRRIWSLLVKMLWSLPANVSRLKFICSLTPSILRSAQLATR